VPSKEHRRGAVKKPVTSRQRTFETLARSISRMDVDYDFELSDHPNWMRALERDTGENPVDLEVNRRLDRAGKTRAQMNRVLAFQGLFAELLPREAGPAWLELTRVMLSVRAAESIMHFNVGVDLGRNMTSIVRAMESARIKLDQLHETRLFTLAHEVGVIARELADAQAPPARGKGGARGKR
jgi:hypothetical protein